MIPSIPIATDNVYKFLALFGLVLVISTMIGIVYTWSKYNDMLYKNILELEALKTKETLSPIETITKTGIEHMNKIYVSDRRFVNWVLSAFCILGLFVTGLGFFFWWTRVQPQQDQLINLQIAKLKRELHNLDKQLK